MNCYETAQITIAANPTCEDRVLVRHHEKGVLIVVADGAGGVSGGKIAAQTVVDSFEQDQPFHVDPDLYVAKLHQIDSQIDLGESTAVVINVLPDQIVGASVGDSQAWEIGEKPVDLTIRQNRKPRLGTGMAVPVGIKVASFSNYLIVATDGFWNYAKPAQLFKICLWGDFHSLPRRLAESVKLPSGQMWDDIGLVVCRRKPTITKRIRTPRSPLS